MISWTRYEKIESRGNRFESIREKTESIDSRHDTILYDKITTQPVSLAHPCILVWIRCEYINRSEKRLKLLISPPFFIPKRSFLIEISCPQHCNFYEIVHSLNSLFHKFMNYDYLNLEYLDFYTFRIIIK